MPVLQNTPHTGSVLGTCWSPIKGLVSSRVHCVWKVICLASAQYEPPLALPHAGTRGRGRAGTH